MIHQWNDSFVVWKNSFVRWKGLSVGSTKAQRLKDKKNKPKDAPEDKDTPDVPE